MILNNRPLFYAQGTRRRREGGLGRVFAGALVAVLFLLAWFFRAPLQEFFWQLAAPLMRARFAPAIDAATPADRDALYAENVELKRMLGRSVAFERVLAAVLLRPPATPYDTLVLDAGSAEGLAVGDRVAAGGVVLGEVRQVYTHAARATLYSAPGEEYQALLHRGSAVISLTLKGQGGGSLQAQVPTGAGVVVGDEAVIPGIYSGVLAKVIGVDRGASDSFSTVYFQLPVSLSSLHFVEVWKTPSHDTN